MLVLHIIASIMRLPTDPLFPPPIFDKQRTCELVNAFWPDLEVRTPEDLIEDDYSTLINHIATYLQELSPYASEFAAKTFESLFLIISKLGEDRAVTRDGLQEHLKSCYLNTPESSIRRSVDLAIRLWLGLNVSSIASVGPRNARDSRIIWRSNEQFGQMVAAQFPKNTGRPPASTFPLDEAFTAVNLRNICRLQIRWTSNLQDHLKISGPRGHRVLSIYQHKVCLINHFKGPQKEIIGENVLKETIRTLDLLFPLADANTEAFLKEEGICMHSFHGHTITSSISINDFDVWRPKLEQLLGLFNGPPESVAQTLLDTRNINQWITLWIAIFGVFLLTTVFGILATVYTIKQYRLAVVSYDLSVDSFQLSRLVACQQKTEPLPGFCD